MRVAEIDRFRGFTIVAMVFFSLISILSRTLPDVLAHNAEKSLHIGDFVFPMFLFASGMSLVFFHRRREGKKAGGYALDVAERTGKLAIIWFFLSPVSSGEFLGMDEVLLSAILFVISLILLRFGWAGLAAGAALPALAYAALAAIGGLPDFSLGYLGGYQAILFWLPVMIGGVMAGIMLERLERFLLASLVAAALLLLVFPPYKMELSPSFMALSVSFAASVFIILRKTQSGVLEYIGKAPIRYWVLMFLMFIVPTGFYAISRKLDVPLPLGWVEAVVLSSGACIAIFAASKALDAAGGFAGKVMGGKVVLR
ncbi:MAG: heparan-alpha-glucosaminide N-acetyltransferase domain-containing protein [Candidatus Micrarchaeota archaeon]